jgi:tyrosyl-tRNA synthetase
MRISDEQLPEWYGLVLEQDPPDGDPLEAKLALARWIVSRSHGDEGARAAEEHFTRVVREGGAPAEEDIPPVQLPAADPVHLPALISDGGLAPSTSEARRLISQGAVKIDGEPTTDLDVPRERLDGALLQVGKRRFARLVA